MVVKLAPRVLLQSTIARQGQPQIIRVPLIAQPGQTRKLIARVPALLQHLVHARRADKPQERIAQPGQQEAHSNVQRWRRSPEPAEGAKPGCPMATAQDAALP